MKALLALAILLLSFTILIAEAGPLSQKLDEIKKITRASKMLNRIKNLPKVSELSVECALCGIAVNEVEGLLLENRTVTEIESKLKDDICSWMSGSLKTQCDEIADALPLIIKLIESQFTVDAVCIELGVCSKPFDTYPDPQPVPEFTINLDLPPHQRYDEVCSVPAYQATAQFLYNTVSSLLGETATVIEDLGELINYYYISPTYAKEIQGCADKLGVTYGWLTFFNMGYELSDACTSIVAQTNDGKILHGRNMDFWAGMGFTDSLKNMTYKATFVRGGETQFVSTTFAGFVGVLSGMKPHGFSVSVNTRFYPGGIIELFEEVIAALEEKNATLVTFLSRDVLMNENDYAGAIDNLSGGELIADCYYIVAGVKAGEGAVISRNRLNPADVWTLDAPTRWFEAQTNYDHWEQPPWYDDRRDPANAAMEKLDRDNLNLDGIMTVLKTKPVLNLQTTFTHLACPADGTYETYTRWCEYPCVQ